VPTTRVANDRLMLLAIVWEAASYHCEYWTHQRRRSGGCLRLLIGGHVALERDVSGVDDMLPLAWYWRRTLAGPHAPLDEGSGQVCDFRPSIPVHSAN
jgi:hypothetical protein